METKYGLITDGQFEKYRKSVIGRIYAILPMKEENIPTVDEYIAGLCRELVESVDVFDKCERILSVVCLLNGVATQADHALYRKDILRCCNIVAEEVDEK